MHHQYNDGGRAEAGYKGTTGDCVCRAVSIASGLPYQIVYERLADGNAIQRLSKRQRKPRPKSARNGISTKRKWFQDYMRELGATWQPCCQIGLGAAPLSSLPQNGRLAVKFRRHYAAVIDGVLQDSWDASYGRDRAVYGYWKFP
jgi:hypothetical protein